MISGGDVHVTSAKGQDCLTPLCRVQKSADFVSFCLLFGGPHPVWISNLHVPSVQNLPYGGANKDLYVLLSRTQAGPGRTVKQEQEEISRNHVQTLIYLSVVYAFVWTLL